jgi:3D (Asp-Asp-Asp) domain-containing protein
MSAEEMKMSMFYTWVQNRSFEFIPTHYIVGCSWDFVKVNDMERVVGATLNSEANLNGVHIEIVGDFNLWEPNDAQYEMVNQLIQWILEKHPWMEIKWHKDFQAKNCPWVNFDWSRIKTYKEPEYIEFSLSRYYSVIPNQNRYYNGRSYEDDFKINCAWDCLVTANGHQLTNNDKYKSVACPKEYPLGTKIWLDGVGEVVCNDRGSAIKTKNWEVRLDMRCWIWDDALDNWSKCPTWKRKWYIIE